MYSFKKKKTHTKKSHNFFALQHSQRFFDTFVTVWLHGVTVLTTHLLFWLHTVIVLTNGYINFVWLHSGLNSCIHSCKFLSFIYLSLRLFDTYVIVLTTQLLNKIDYKISLFWLNSYCFDYTMSFFWLQIHCIDYKLNVSTTLCNCFDYTMSLF
jgi:hypothetical protein